MTIPGDGTDGIPDDDPSTGLTMNEDDSVTGTPSGGKHKRTSVVVPPDDCVGTYQGIEGPG